MSKTLVLSTEAPELHDWPYQSLNDLHELDSTLKNSDFSANFIYINLPEMKIKDLFKNKKYMASKAHFIFNVSKLSPQTTKELVNFFKNSSLLNSEDNGGLKSHLIRLVEQRNFSEQYAHLNELVHAERSKLENMNRELEQLVNDDRQRLNKTQKRATRVVKLTEAYHHSILKINKAKSLGSVETSLSEVLNRTIGVNFVRIIHQPQFDSFISNLKKKSLKYFSENIDPDSEISPSIIYVREGIHNYNRSEVDLLNEITECVRLSLIRITNLEKLESLRSQWESTFDSISESICILDSSMVVKRSNKEFKKFIGQLKIKASEIGATLPALKLLLANYSPRNENEIEQALEIEGQTHTFRISIHRADDKNFVCILSDCSHEKRLERQIIESAKMAELGLIGSSIAHELNNPLGGMISFLQLIKMDVPKEHRIYNDVVEMEAASFRCKEIIESLLGFARKQSFSDYEQLNIIELVNQAIELNQIQSKYQNVEILFKELPETEYYIVGQRNSLVQAIKNVLQNSIEAVLERLESDDQIKGVIKIDISLKEQDVIIKVVDNGIGINPTELQNLVNPLFTTKAKAHHSGLGLTVAYQIIKDHNGNLEFFSRPNIETQAIFSFKRLDLTRGRQVFDSKL